MRILILDDDDQRHNYFASEFWAHDIVHTHTYLECLEKLSSEERFDVAFLDHDLNFNQYESLREHAPHHERRAVTQYTKGDELDGRDVAEEMGKLPHDKRPHQVIVHSWNPGGAIEMMNILRDAGYKNVVRWVFDPRKKFAI